LPELHSGYVQFLNSPLSIRMFFVALINALTALCDYLDSKTSRFPRSHPSPTQLSSQSSAKCQPDLINNRQNSRSDQELFLLRSLSMDNHNAIRFLHPTHVEDKEAGLPPQERGAARPVSCAPCGVLISAWLDVHIVPVNTVQKLIARKGNPAAELFDERTSGCG